MSKTKGPHKLRAWFLISNTVVPNPYSHSTAFDPQYFAPF